MNQVRLHQVMQFCSVKLSCTYVEKTLKTFALAVPFNIKNKLFGSKVCFDMMRHALNSHSRKEALFGQFDVLEGYSNEGSVFSEEYFFFINHEAASYDVFLSKSGTKVFKLISVLTFDIVSNLTIGFEAKRMSSEAKFFLSLLSAIAETNQNRPSPMKLACQRLVLPFVIVHVLDLDLEIEEVSLLVEVNRSVSQQSLQAKPSIQTN